MGMQPHVHTTEEVKRNISSIEHQGSGPGSPSGKKSGAPMPPAGGSVKNESTKTPGVTGSTSGDDVVQKRY